MNDKTDNTEVSTEPEKPVAQISSIFDRGRIAIIKETGVRGLILGGSSTATDTWIQVSEGFTPHGYRQYRPFQLELAPKKTNFRKGYDLKEDFSPIIHGMVTLPNWEPFDDVAVGVNYIAGGGGLQYGGRGYPKVPGKDRGDWGTFFLSTEQGGYFGGSGVVMIYGQGGKGIIGKFAICKHEKQVGGGANPIRGWHPGSCKLCGLDMTVDSSD